MKFKVTQRGRSENKWRHQRLTQAVTYYARTLRIPNPKHLDIALLMSSDKKMMDANTRGECIYLPNSFIDGKPHKFKIVIQRDMPWTQTLVTFAHEMVHVHQMSSGILRYKWDPQLCRWLASWNMGPWEVKEHIDYWQRPWEIDARSKEQELCEAFFKVEVPIGTYYYEGNNG